MAASLLSNASSIIWPKRPIFSHGQFRSNLSFPPQQLQPPHLAIQAHRKRTLKFAVKASGQEKSKLTEDETNENEQGGKVEAASNNKGHMIHFATVSFFIILFALLLRLQPTFQIFPFNQQRTKTPEQNFLSSSLPMPEKPNKTRVLTILSPFVASVLAILLSINKLMDNIIAIKDGINYAINFYYRYKVMTIKGFLWYLGIVFVVTMCSFGLLILLWRQMNKIISGLKEQKGKSGGVKNS